MEWLIVSVIVFVVVLWGLNKEGRRFDRAAQLVLKKRKNQRKDQVGDVSKNTNKQGQNEQPDKMVRRGTNDRTPPSFGSMDDITDHAQEEGRMLDPLNLDELATKANDVGGAAPVILTEYDEIRTPESGLFRGNDADDLADVAEKKSTLLREENGLINKFKFHSDFKKSRGEMQPSLGVDGSQKDGLLAPKTSEERLGQNAAEVENKGEHDIKAGAKSEAIAEADSAFTHLRQIDYWAKLVGRERQAGVEIMRWAESMENRLKYPFAVHGLAVPSLSWKDLTRAGSEGDEYKDIVVAVQLVERGSAIDAKQLQQFDKLLRQYAKKTGREIYFVAESEEALAQAQRLEAFVKECHGAIEVAVIAPEDEPFSGALLESSAQQQGLELQAGRFVRMKAVGTTSTTLYEVFPLGEARFPNLMTADIRYIGVKFRMVPARSQKPSRVAKEMLDAVKAFGSRVSGTIRVPGYEEYQSEQMSFLVNGVGQLERRMEGAGIKPGGAEALRIFDLV